MEEYGKQFIDCGHKDVHTLWFYLYATLKKKQATKTKLKALVVSIWDYEDGGDYKRAPEDCVGVVWGVGCVIGIVLFVGLHTSDKDHGTVHLKELILL